MTYPIFYPVGDSAISAQFGNTISVETNKKIRTILQSFSTNPVLGIVELVPTYCALLIQYDPILHSYEDMCHIIKERSIIGDDMNSNGIVRIVEIPTVYGGEYGPDLEFVASHSNLSIEEVIAIHSSTDYLVYMLGFIPGFTYLGGMDQRIATPRLSSPRTHIAAGSVGIAGNQTGIYPSESPGGWQIIGRTPLVMYDGNKEDPTLVRAGDYVRYVPISEDGFLHMFNHLEQYEPIVHHCKEEEVRHCELQ
ncbi:5-oxoprolinase subunit PxpB [Veillonella agrestimuris]|uniref:5-oxoprolinase subunit PxpB n=1 Tax=Veillonella agrestimuris TaxID=2941340 RepID=UPI00203D929A|nr:5-oxoprolinase subunit PxpB [Veillonella agrestimuris]